MPRLSKSLPKYRKHKASGQALVTLDGKDFYLGPHDSPESHARYYALLAEYNSNGRRAPESPSHQIDTPVTVGQVVAEWVERGRGMALGIVYVGSNLGGVLLVPIAVAVADQGSWRDAILVLSGCAIFVLLPAAAFLVRSPEEGEGRRAREQDRNSRHASRADSNRASAAVALPSQSAPADDQHR